MNAQMRRMKATQKSPAAANVDSRLFNDIMSVQILFHKMLFHRLKPSGLTAGQPKILEFLAARGEAVQREIASASDIGAPTAARILSKMEASGLIQRAHREGNRSGVPDRAGYGYKPAASYGTGRSGCTQRRKRKPSVAVCISDG